MAVTPASKFGVFRPAARIVLHGDFAPSDKRRWRGEHGKPFV